MSQPDAAVAMVRAGSPEESILLIRRTERLDDPWSGHWSFPGGRRDDSDRDLLHTALRELEEECGIRLPREQLERELPHRWARRQRGKFVLVAPFVFHVSAEMPTLLDAREAVESRWVPLRMLRDPAMHSLREVPGLPMQTLFPAFELGSVPLWGFTYRLVVDWLNASAPADGFWAARTVLDFLLSLGLEQRSEWEDGAEGKRVRVCGAIPVADVLDYFQAPAHFMPAVNRLEVQSGRVIIAGPGYEEYVIESTALC